MAQAGPPASVSAHYEYSPFGETIAAVGPEAQDNPFRFSTKYFVDELGIGDWSRRWYIPPLGRWLSRDPSGEEGGMNLYLFAENSPVTLFDVLGLAIWEMSFSKSEAHGTIERYRPPFWFWPWSYYEQLTASKGRPASASWGYVAFDYSVADSTFVAGVSAMTDMSHVPNDTTLLSASSSVQGDVTIKACCTSHKVDVKWDAHGDQELGRTSTVEVHGIKYQTSRIDPAFIEYGTFSLDMGSVIGTVKFNILVYTAWMDVPPSTISQWGSATLSATAVCQPD